MEQENKKKATAPYNFVPLPGKAVESPLGEALPKDKDGIPDYSKYKEYIKDHIKKNDAHDGYLSFEIETLTPLFIGDGTGKFFAPDGTPVIPGSTIRGMIKNYMKILTCGTMIKREDITERQLYFRDCASGNALNEYYKKRFGEEKAQPGFLAKKDGKYYIYEADATDYKFSQYADEDDAFVQPEEDASLMFNKSSYCEYTLTNGLCVQSGYFDGKKHYYKFNRVLWQKCYEVPENVLQSYRNDSSRKGTDLLKYAKNDDSEKIKLHSILKFFDGNNAHGLTFLMPCFYVIENNEIAHFGAQENYRIQYKDSVFDRIPDTVNQENIIDFADSLFGRKEFFAGRLYFEDAGITDRSLRLKDPEQSKVLMTPNPTSFQLYLEQPKENPGSENKKKRKRPLFHWDSDTVIRGYKLYWHKKNYDWKGVAGESDWEQSEGYIMQPVPAKTVFKGRIRFKNLTDIEIGALISVLSLGDSKFSDGRFKIGMGKPLGMGSIDLRCLDKKIINSTTRYSTLFDINGKWETSLEDIDVLKCVQDFKYYISKKTTESDYNIVLSALNAMMSWKKVPNPQDIAYMPVGDDRFKDRIPLPHPEDVIKK